MTKQEFLKALSSELKCLSDAERARSVEYYREIIEERIEEGSSEEAAVAALGDPAERAGEIVSEQQSDTEVASETTAQKNKAKLSPLWITLIVIGSPLWITAAAVIVSLILAAVCVIAACITAIIAALIGVTACGILLLPTSAVVGISSGIFSAVFTFGCAAVLIGISVLLWRPIFIAVGKIFHACINGFRRLFGTVKHRKESVKL